MVGLETMESKNLLGESLMSLIVGVAAPAALIAEEEQSRMVAEESDTVRRQLDHWEQATRADTFLVDLAQPVVVTPQARIRSQPETTAPASRPATPASDRPALGIDFEFSNGEATSLILTPLLAAQTARNRGDVQGSGTGIVFVLAVETTRVSTASTGFGSISPQAGLSSAPPAIVAELAIRPMSVAATNPAASTVAPDAETGIGSGTRSGTASSGTVQSGRFTPYYQFTQLDNLSPIDANSAARPVNTGLGVPLLPDSLDGTNVDPDYLLRLDIKFDQPANAPIKISRKDGPALAVYADQGATSPLLPHRSGLTEVEITLEATNTKTVWVGWDGSYINPTANLTLLVGMGAATGTNDIIKFARSDVLIVGIAGHTQSSPVNPTIVDAGVGVHEIYENLLPFYPHRLYPEDPGNQEPLNTDSCGDGVDRAHEDIKKAFNEHRAKRLGLYGYSHGGGSTLYLSELLRQDVVNGDIENYSLKWSGYIDAIQVVKPVGNDTGIIKGAEIRQPRLTKSHFNRFQSRGFPNDPLHGWWTTRDQTPDTPYNQSDTDTTDDVLHHTNENNKGIAEDSGVQQQLIASLKFSIPRA